MTDTSGETRNNIDFLTKNAEIYNITLDELEVYDGRNGSKNSERIKEARENGQDHFLMVMIPEGAKRDEIADIARIVEQVRGGTDEINDDKIAGLQKKGYLLITEPEVITKIETDFSDKIHSFKEALFPEGEVQEHGTVATAYADRIERQRSTAGHHTEHGPDKARAPER